MRLNYYNGEDGFLRRGNIWDVTRYLGSVIRLNSKIKFQFYMDIRKIIVPVQNTFEVANYVKRLFFEDWEYEDRELPLASTKIILAP